jgi:hypothetical protein
LIPTEGKKNAIAIAIARERETCSSSLPFSLDGRAMAAKP